VVVLGHPVEAEAWPWDMSTPLMPDRGLIQSRWVITLEGDKESDTFGARLANLQYTG